jgi:hypothetical protein
VTITRTLLTSGGSTVDGYTFQTASIAPAAGKVLIVGIEIDPGGTTGPDGITVTGCGLTWDFIDRSPGGSSTRSAMFFRAASGTAPGSGALTITCPSTVLSNGIMWFVVQYDGVATGNNGADGILQSVIAQKSAQTAPSLTLPNPVTAGNETLAIIGCASGTAITPAAGCTQLDYQSITAPIQGALLEYANPPQQTMGATFAASANAFMIALELQAAPSGPSLRAVYSSGAQSNAIPLNVPGVVIKKDDVVVVVALTSDYLRRINAPPTGLTGAAFVEEGGVYGQVNYANAYSWTAKATQDETVTISAVPSGGNAGADYVVMHVYVCQNAEGAGDTIVGGGWASAKGSATLPSLTQTNVADHSIILFAAVDWNARSATGAAFTNTGGAGTPTTDYAVSTTAAGYYMAEYLDAGSAGVKTVGMTAPASQKWSAISIEVVGKGLGPQVPREQAILHLDAISDLQVAGFGSTTDLLAMSASSAAVFGGAFQFSAVLAPRATPALSIGALRTQPSGLIVAGQGGLSVQNSPTASVLLAALSGLTAAGSESRSAVLSVVGTGSLALSPVRTQVGALSVSGAASLAISGRRTLTQVLAAVAASGLTVSTGATAVLPVAGVAGKLTLAAMQTRFAVVVMSATSGLVDFVVVTEQLHDWHRVVANVLDSGARVAVIKSASLTPNVLLDEKFADLSKWRIPADGAVTVSNGQLVMKVNANWTGGTNSQDPYPLLDGGEIRQKTVYASGGDPGWNGTDVDSWFQLSSSATGNVNDLVMEVTGGRLLTSRDIGGARTQGINIVFDPVAHRWWRFRRVAGVVFWETSPDGKVWTTVDQWAPTFATDALYLTIGTGYDNAGTPVPDYVVSDVAVYGPPIGAKSATAELLSFGAIAVVNP